MNIEEYQSESNRIIEKLQALETEKSNIMERYENAGITEKILLEKQMQSNISNFQQLSRDATALSKKIKVLKN